MALETEPTQPAGDAVASPAAPGSDESRQWLGNVRAGVKARLFDDAPQTLTPEGTVRAPSSSHEPPRIGRYLVIKRIGAGGMGVVYAAYDDQLDRKVAVKLLRPGFGPVSQTARQRLLREAQAIARLSHRSVIQVYEVGTHEDEVFVAMEYVEGSTLKQWQPSRDWREILVRYLDAGRGLCAAHAAGIVHRDFKADNVLVRAADLAVRVVDFGLARTNGQSALERDHAHVPEPEVSASLTHSGVIMGTPAYMAPEQHLALPTDPRTDQYSFCASLFEALYGYRAFAGDRLEELRCNVLDGAVEPAPRYTTVPPKIHKALVRGLSVDPDARFPTMEALVAELELPASASLARRITWALGLGTLAIGGSLLFSNTAAGPMSPESMRMRAEFDVTALPTPEVELQRLEARDATQRWNDLVLAYAATATSPTTTLAALKLLSTTQTHGVDAARTIAANATRRGPVFAMRPTSTPVRRVVFSPGSTHLAAMTEGGAVLRWASPPGRVPTKVSFEVQPIDIALAADGHLHVVLGGGTLATLAPDQETPVYRHVHDGELTTIASDGRGQLAIGAMDGTVLILRDDTTRSLREHNAAVGALAFHPHTDVLASGDRSGRVALWFLDRGTHRTMGIDRAIERLSWFPVEGTVVALTSGGPAAWDGTRGTQSEPPIPRAVERLAVARNGAVRVENGPHGAMATLEDESSLRLDTLDEATDLAVSGGGQWAAAAGEAGVTLWRTGPDESGVRPNGDLRFEVSAEIVGLHLRADAVIVVTSEGHVLESRTGRSLRSIADLHVAVHASAASEDQRRVALETTQGALYILDLDQPSAPVALGTVDEPSIGPFVWSADNTTLAKLHCPSDMTTCQLALHPSDGSAARGLGSTDAEPRTLHVSPSGDRVAVVHAEHVAIWDSKRGERGRFRPPSRPLAAAFDSRGALRIASRDVGSGAPALHVGQVGDDGSLDPLFVEDGLRRVFATADATGVVLESSSGRTLLWQLSEDRFISISADPLPSPETPEVHVAPDLTRLWVAFPASAEVELLDLETGQRRILPRPAGVFAWTHDGGWADVHRSHTLRRWGASAPRTPKEFAEWLQTRTQVEIPLAALQTPMSGSNERL